MHIRKSPGQTGDDHDQLRPENAWAPAEQCIPQHLGHLMYMGSIRHYEGNNPTPYIIHTYKHIKRYPVTPKEK